MKHLLALFLSLFAGSATAGPLVVATLPDLAAIAREVVEPDGEVHTLSSPRQDPHYVDPRPSLVLELNRAALVVRNGLQLEDAWLLPLVQQARNQAVMPGAPGSLDVSRAVSLLEVPATLDRSQGDIHPGGNPHFLFDPRRGAKVAIAIGDRMAQLDAAHADGYRARAAALASRLDAFAAAETARFSALPKEKRVVVAYHRSLAYLFDWLGLSQASTIEPRPGIPPDPGHVARVLGLMKSQGVRAIVQEEFYPTNTSKTLADLTRARLVVIPGGTRVADNERYEAHLRAITEALHAALRE